MSTTTYPPKLHTSTWITNQLLPTNMPVPHHRHLLHLETPPNMSFSPPPSTNPSLLHTTTFKNALASANLPSNLLSSPILACTPPSVLHANEKMVFVQLHNSSCSTQVIQAIQTSILFSMPQLSPSFPPSPTIDDIDQSSHPGSTFSRNCRILLALTSMEAMTSLCWNTLRNVTINFFPLVCFDRFCNWLPEDPGGWIHLLKCEKRKKDFSSEKYNHKAIKIQSVPL